jgi:hypothetical protein
MTAPLAQAAPPAALDTLDLLRELDDRKADEHQTLGIRTRIADIEAELRTRAAHRNSAEAPAQVR